MKEVFFIARVKSDMTLELLPMPYASYPDAQAAIPTLAPGRYQVQKFFEVL